MPQLSDEAKTLVDNLFGQIISLPQETRTYLLSLIIDDFVSKKQYEIDKELVTLKKLSEFVIKLKESI